MQPQDLKNKYTEIKKNFIVPEEVTLQHLINTAKYHQVVKDSYPIIQLFKDLIQDMKNGGINSGLTFESVKNLEENMEFKFNNLDFRFEKSHVHIEADDQDLENSSHDDTAVDSFVFILTSGIYESKMILVEQDGYVNIQVADSNGEMLSYEHYSEESQSFSYHYPAEDESIFTPDLTSIEKFQAIKEGQLKIAGMSKENGIFSMKRNGPNTSYGFHNSNNENQFLEFLNLKTGQNLYGYFDNKMRSEFAVETIAKDHYKVGPCKNMKVDSPYIMN